MTRDQRTIALAIPWRVAMGIALVGILAAFTTASRLRGAAAEPMVRAANAWIDSLDPPRRMKAVRPFADSARTDWHFVPRNDRKGVQLRDMTDGQQKMALELLRSAVSAAGYEKATGIMDLDELLRILEGAKAKNIRDPKRYYFTIFGTPADTGSWGLSVEGHHLSLNFTIRDGVLVDSTPQFLGANPAEVKTSFDGLAATGHRVLDAEERLGFELVRSLDAAQRTQAVIAAEAPREIRSAGEPQPASEPSGGIAWRDLSADQQGLLRDLVETYCDVMADDVATQRLQAIEAADGAWAAVRFAWLGALEPGIGHAYRIEGPTFVVEFVNVQPDAEGNPANHIHCVWRDRTGDFDLPPAS